MVELLEAVVGVADFAGVELTAAALLASSPICFFLGLFAGGGAAPRDAAEDDAPK